MESTLQRRVVVFARWRFTDDFERSAVVDANEHNREEKHARIEMVRDADAKLPLSATMPEHSNIALAAGAAGEVLNKS